MDSRTTEFQNIMPIKNIPSVLQYGILSHEKAAKLPHASVDMKAIQDKRDKKQVPGGLKLHQYANLYFHARNPMLSKRRDEAYAGNLCVLRLSTEVLRLDGVVLADCNASSDYVRFLHPTQWRLLPFDDIYSIDWRHPDTITFYRNRSRKCAEVLVPHQIGSTFLTGALVANQDAEERLLKVGFVLPIDVDPAFFFR